MNAEGLRKVSGLALATAEAQDQRRMVVQRKGVR